MWPKMLFELLPHVGRIVPVAEKFFASRGARDQEEQAALVAVSDTLRMELGKVAESYAGLEAALQSQAEQVNAVAEEATRTRVAVEAIEGRLGQLESGIASAEAAAEKADKAAGRLAKFCVAIALLLAGVAGLLVDLIVRLGAH